MGLAQIGEFSFIIASLGLTLKITSDFLYPIAVAVSVLTTLLTPYLIRSADGVVNRLDRVAPRPLARLLDLYTNWANQIGSQSPSHARVLIRRWWWQMMLNATLIAAVFIAMAFIAQHPPELFKKIEGGKVSLQATLWFGAVIFCLPMFIATFRKLQALGLLVAELRVANPGASERAMVVHSIIAQGIPAAGMVVLAVFVLALSSTVLPPLNVLVVLAGIAALTAWLLWRTFIKVYSKAQIALQETLAQPPAPSSDHEAEELPMMLREANLETVFLAKESAASGRMLRELQLRTRTGASIVGIERKGESIVNPGPDEEVRGGDHILLLGTRVQLDAAKAALSVVSTQKAK
jgi:CPA2 family monovalent cation:H+ antiporter-2